jgi:putative nucleotidyltransferase with HDIG domain
MEVSKLCEAAAEAIGANALLARVGAYYHDIGKVNMPQYFIENQDGSENIHDKISPYTSARLIGSHVKDGIELARAYKLPKIIEDLIPQHHGTAMISFFYQKAIESEDGDDINEDDYRYPGPNPQTKEAGIMLLADSVEASSRNIKNPTYSELQNLVEDIINQKLIDSQLDESGLTLKDLRLIADEFVQVLSSSAHLRLEYPKYPEREKEDKKNKKKTKDGTLNLNLKAVMTSQQPSPSKGERRN